MCSIGAIHHPPIEVSVFLHSFKIKNSNIFIKKEGMAFYLYPIEDGISYAKNI